MSDRSGMVCCLPTFAKTLGISALAGAASEGASQVVTKIPGGGQKAYMQNLTEKQKRDLLNALETGSDFTIRPTATVL